jgi:SH3-like domain-containing protein
MITSLKKILPVLLVFSGLAAGSVAVLAAEGADMATAAGAADMAVASADSAAVLPVPRFVTLATNEVNLRTGPGLRYPVKVVIKRSGLPVEIIREFDVWRQVRDVDGAEGWVHKSMLSGRRSVIVRGQMQTLLRDPKADARPVAKLEPGVIASVAQCAEKWCSIEVGGYGGWLKKENLWGVYPDEMFKE